MTPLKPRQERFCRRFVELGCAATAARAAGYAPRSANNAGYRLLRVARIGARIAAIEAERGDAHCDSREVLLGKLETVFRRAIVDHQFATAARAVDLQARLRGFTAAGADAGAASDDNRRRRRGRHGLAAPAPDDDF
ncbi:MAG: terminase small subunit [Rhodospirillales bacterium]